MTGITANDAPAPAIRTRDLVFESLRKARLLRHRIKAGAVLDIPGWRTANTPELLGRAGHIHRVRMGIRCQDMPGQHSGPFPWPLARRGRFPPFPRSKLWATDAAPKSPSDGGGAPRMPHHGGKGGSHRPRDPPGANLRTTTL